jgi:hypothetical protein
MPEPEPWETPAPEAENVNPYKPGTRRFLIVEAYQAGFARKDIFDRYVDFVGALEPWIFSQNVGGKRQVRPLNEQRRMARYEINRTVAEMERGGTKVAPKTQAEKSVPEIPEAPAPKPEPRPPANPLRAELQRWQNEVWRLRDWCDTRAGDNDTQRVDHISTRTLVNGVSMIQNGIPVDACLFAATIHWPMAARQDAGVREYDFTRCAEKVDAALHPLAGYVVKLAKARIPIYLVGPAGSGKSVLARQLAKLIFDDSERYGEVPLTAGATPSWLTGAETVSGYKTRPFIEIYRNGGVFNFEEMDAADPNMLMVVNNALANDRFYNPASGEMIERHPDFIPVATGNTWGLGANRFYGARERLDFATVDRWRMGRVFVPMSKDVERNIIESALVAAE